LKYLGKELIFVIVTKSYAVYFKQSLE